LIRLLNLIRDGKLRGREKMLKPTQKEIKEMKKFANRGATSTMDAIGKKCLRNAVEHKDWNDDNVRGFIEMLRKKGEKKNA